MYQVTAVINNNVRFTGQSLFYKVAVGFRIRAVDGKRMNTADNQCGHDIVFGGHRVAAGDGHLSPACGQNPCQIGGFCFQMNRKRYAFSGKRLFLCETLFQCTQQRHMGANPGDFLLTLWC